MESLFIPPPGALQFEVTLMRRPETQAMMGSAIWVTELSGAPGENPFCECKTGWSVLIESVSGAPRAFLEERRKLGAIITVCPCNGRIIE